MKILFVAMPFSIHTARWISQLDVADHDVHLFSSMIGHDLHETIRGVTFHENFYESRGQSAQENQYSSIALRQLSFVKAPVIKKIIRKTLSGAGLFKSRVDLLKKVIEKLNPDIIHSLETQHAGYLVSEVKKMSAGKFPLWIHSNWGIDLHFYGRLLKHEPLIRQTLSQVDVFITEGRRDELLARKFGFKGPVYTFPSVGGGFHIPAQSLNKTSSRRKILVKGTQDMIRRNLVGLRALERCNNVLSGYEIMLYSSNDVTQAAAELFYANTGKKITVLHHVSHEEMLELNGNARLNICINMSDGVPNAMLEAMMMGAFPIQSDTSLANEWITNGETGMIVPPEDPEVIEQAIRKALANDDMVDNAAVINRKKIMEKLDYQETKSAVLKMYSDQVISK